MSRISGASHSALNQLERATSALQNASLRLSTLRSINRAADDPAGLIAAESLRGDLTAIAAAADSAEQVRAQVHVADSSLGQASDLINEIRGHVVTAANDAVSPDERRALQLEIDASLEALDRLGRTTEFNGRRLLDGTATLQVTTSPDLTQSASVSLPEVSTAALGDSAGSLEELHSGGSADLASGDSSRAAAILDAAQSQVSQARMAAGTFERTTIDATQAIFDSQTVNLSSAASQIADADVASEAAELVRATIQTKVAIAVVRLTNQRADLLAMLLRA